ncbi:MAG: diphthine synthase [Thermoplasmata archaeon]
MGELLFVGAGLGDEEDLSPRARAAIRSASEVLWEGYTSGLAEGARERLEQWLGRPIPRLDREEIETGARVQSALERGARVALIVAGDPFVATTHVALRSWAIEAGHSWRYFPNATVLSAVPSLLGLMHYRFGRTVSVPFPEPGFHPTSPLEAIAANQGSGLHTLVLLDLRPGEGRFMTAPEAIGLLTQMEGGGRPRLSVDQRWCVAARVGSEDADAWWGTREELLGYDFGSPLHALVVPAPELHFEEARALELWRGRRPSDRSPGGTPA